MVALRAILSTHPPTPTSSEQASHRGGAGGAGPPLGAVSRVATAEQSPPRSQAIAPLSPCAHSWGPSQRLRPTSQPLSSAGPAPPALSTPAAGHLAAGHPSATRLESGSAPRPFFTPPDPPWGGWDKINDNYRLSDLTIIVHIDNLSTDFISHITYDPGSICICYRLDLSLQGQFIV